MGLLDCRFKATLSDALGLLGHPVSESATASSDSGGQRWAQLILRSGRGSFVELKIFRDILVPPSEERRPEDLGSRTLRRRRVVRSGGAELVRAPHRRRLVPGRVENAALDVGVTLWTFAETRAVSPGRGVACVQWLLLRCDIRRQTARDQDVGSAALIRVSAVRGRVAVSLFGVSSHKCTARRGLLPGALSCASASTGRPFRASVAALAS